MLEKILSEHRRIIETNKREAKYREMETRGEFKGLVHSEIIEKMGIKYLPGSV